MLVVLDVKVTRLGLNLEEIDLGPVKQKILTMLLDRMYSKAYDLAPWRTGFLAQSLTKEQGNDYVALDDTAPYAPFVVKGTAPHEIRPVTAQALCFQISGETVFAKLVRHPGTSPNPFMETARDEALAELPDTFQVVWEEEYPEP